MASKSEEIRRLLQAEPGTTPARLRDILKARGIEVDTHLVRLVRRNWIEAGRPQEKEPPSRAQIEEWKQRAREYTRQWAKRKKEEEARRAEEKARERWHWMWIVFTNGWTPFADRYGRSEDLLDLARKHHVVQQYNLHQAALRRGAYIPPEDYMDECLGFPDLTTNYVELIYQICTGKLIHGEAVRLVEPLLRGGFSISLRDT